MRMFWFHSPKTWHASSQTINTAASGGIKYGVFCELILFASFSFNLYFCLCVWYPGENWGRWVLYRVALESISNFLWKKKYIYFTGSLFSPAGVKWFHAMWRSQMSSLRSVLKVHDRVFREIKRSFSLLRCSMLPRLQSWGAWCVLVGVPKALPLH